MTLKIISLMKQVPVPSEMRMGADGLMDRTKAKSIINVDCTFALEQALQIKNQVPDAELIVLSMGPASFEQSLRKAVAMGFDRAVLLSDRRLGGSDTFVTGLCLAAALRKLGFDKDSPGPFIVFAGRQTSDGDTAHVPSQVGENLGIPQATFVDKVDLAGDHLVVRRIIEGGHQSLKLPLPCVVSIAPTAIPARRPSLAGTMRAKKADIEKLDLAEVGVSPDRVGLDGSPTLVAKVVNIERHRPPVAFAVGDTPAELVDDLCEKIERPPASFDLPRVVEDEEASANAAGGKHAGYTRIDFREGARGILTWVEMHGTRPAASSLEILAPARRLADQLETRVISVVIGHGVGEAAKEVIARGADEAILVDDPRLAEYRILPFARIIAQVATEMRPEIALFAATTSGRELAPRIATRVHAGVTADCTSLEVGEYVYRRKKQILYPVLEAIRPTYGESKLATIVGFTCPQIATARPGTFKSLPPEGPRKGEVTLFRPQLEPEDFAAEILETVREEGGGQALFHADIIITGGRPCGEHDGLQMVRDLAQALRQQGLNAEWGATRQTVDNGFAPYARQIGQTGKTVRPRVYLAVAVSGAVQHVIGMSESNKIVAVNHHAHANIFRSADVGVVGDYENLFPELIKRVREGFSFGLEPAE
ncbi:MAG: FAD-binding protein [Chromatiaceae bacterium]|jgi:electron transfer flavoprotein alpha subunit